LKNGGEKNGYKRNARHPPCQYRGEGKTDQNSKRRMDEMRKDTKRDDQR